MSVPPTAGQSPSTSRQQSAARRSLAGKAGGGAPSRRCIAFVHSEAHDELWTPCVEAAGRGGVLCRNHGEALAGVFLGLLEHPAADAAASEEAAIREAMRLGASYFSNQYWQGKARQEAASSRRPAEVWREGRADRAGSPPAVGGSMRHDPSTSLRVIGRETEP